MRQASGRDADAEGVLISMHVPSHWLAYLQAVDPWAVVADQLSGQGKGVEVSQLSPAQLPFQLCGRGEDEAGRQGRGGGGEERQ